MPKSRTQKAFLNACCELLLEVVTAICSFILPRLILSNFGSAYNGIISSITQFISCVGLLQSGIGGVTRAALYKPLAENDSIGISEIVNATSHFMRRIALIFSAAVVIFAAVYPALVSEDFDWLFTFTLVLILSISTFAQYFFGMAYQMVIKADQRMYIISIVNIATTIANTIVAVILINAGNNIHIVKLASAIVYVFPPIFYNVWVKKKYQIFTRVAPKKDVLAQRWDAFGHQVANFINTNTDVIVATIFLGVKEVSVYTVFYMIGNSIKKLIMSMCSGLTAAFGNMMAKGQNDILKKRFKQFEMLVFFATTILLTAATYLICPFVKLYTSGVNDINYNRPVFGYLICASIYVSSLKIPYEELVYAAGAFKQTRNGAFIEAGMNIVLSVILVNFIGLNGILIGTIIAILYRMLRYHVYICDKIITRNKFCIIKHFLFSCITVVACFLIYRRVPFSQPNGYIQWILLACVITVVTVIVASVVALLMFPKEFIELRLLLKRFLVRKAK